MILDSGLHFLGNPVQTYRVWETLYVRLRVLPVSQSYAVNSTGCLFDNVSPTRWRQRITDKMAGILFKTRSTGTPAYLSNLIHDYTP